MTPCVTSPNENVEFQNDRIISVAQDLVYGCGAGTKWTTKHIGLSSTLHIYERLWFNGCPGKHGK